MAAKWLRDLLAYKAETYADEWAKEYVKPAFAGDVEAAENLATALTTTKRGEMARCMWEAKVDRPVYRAYLASVWDHDYAHVIHAAGTRRCLASMFRYAAFELPSAWSDEVTVWRGTLDVPLDVARQGYSWTTRPEIACWFAMRHVGDARQDIRPLVITTRVKKHDIGFFNMRGDENEVVVLRAPVRAAVYADPPEWSRAAKFVTSEIAEHNQSLLNRSLE